MVPASVTYSDPSGSFTLGPRDSLTGYLFHCLQYLSLPTTWQSSAFCPLACPPLQNRDPHGGRALVSCLSLCSQHLKQRLAEKAPRNTNPKECIYCDMVPQNQRKKGAWPAHRGGRAAGHGCTRGPCVWGGLPDPKKLPHLPRL